MLARAAARSCEHDAAVRRGEWHRTGDHMPWDAPRRDGRPRRPTARIGRRWRSGCAGFGVRILVTDPGPERRPRRRAASRCAELLARRDVVSLHAPLGPRDRRADRRATRLALMRPARDPRQHRARRAGRRGRARRARCATGELARRRARRLRATSRPPATASLGAPQRGARPPHVAGLSERSVDEMTRRATASVVDVLAGRRPADVANPAVLRPPAPWLSRCATRSPPGAAGPARCSRSPARRSPSSSPSRSTSSGSTSSTARSTSRRPRTLLIGAQAAGRPRARPPAGRCAPSAGRDARCRRRRHRARRRAQRRDRCRGGRAAARTRPTASRGYGLRRAASRGRTGAAASQRPVLWAQIESAEGVARRRSHRRPSPASTRWPWAPRTSPSRSGVPLRRRCARAARRRRCRCATRARASAAFGVAGALDGAPPALLAGAAFAIHSTDARPVVGRGRRRPPPVSAQPSTPTTRRPSDARLPQGSAAGTAPRSPTEVRATVAEMLSRDRAATVTPRSAATPSELDGWAPPSRSSSARTTIDGRRRVARAGAARPYRVRAGSRSAPSPAAQRATMHDLEIETLPGVTLGHRHIPVAHRRLLRARRALPDARLLVHDDRRADGGRRRPRDRLRPAARGQAASIPAMLYAMATSGADTILALGGVQALAALTYGIEGLPPADIIVGAGNAYVAEAKRAAVRRGRHRPARRPDRGGGDRRRDGRPRARRRRPARPGRARPDLALAS